MYNRSAKNITAHRFLLDREITTLHAMKAKHIRVGAQLLTEVNIFILEIETRSIGRTEENYF
jgi:hypothetical protein